jgi:hypothetical protein
MQGNGIFPREHIHAEFQPPLHIKTMPENDEKGFKAGARHTCASAATSAEEFTVRAMHRLARPATKYSMSA